MYKQCGTEAAVVMSIVCLMNKYTKKGSSAEVHKLDLCTGIILNKYNTVFRKLPNFLKVSLSRWGKRFC